MHMKPHVPQKHEIFIYFFGFPYFLLGTFGLQSVLDPSPSSI